MADAANEFTQQSAREVERWAGSASPAIDATSPIASA